MSESTSVFSVNNGTLDFNGSGSVTLSTAGAELGPLYVETVTASGSIELGPQVNTIGQIGTGDTVVINAPIGYTFHDFSGSTNVVPLSQLQLEAGEPTFTQDGYYEVYTSIYADDQTVSYEGSQASATVTNGLNGISATSYSDGNGPIYAVSFNGTEFSLAQENGTDYFSAVSGGGSDELVTQAIFPSGPAYQDQGSETILITENGDGSITLRGDIFLEGQLLYDIPVSPIAPNEFNGDTLTDFSLGLGGISFDVYSSSGSLVENAFLAVTCFALGTRIATPAGEVPVESLSVGDVVSSLLSGPQPIKLIERRFVDCRGRLHPKKVQPVRVKAGAFGSHPKRDLCLSPDHAVFFNDVLIPVKYLINGSSVAQMEVDGVTYYHIQLDLHDVLLAEGSPCESRLPPSHNNDASSSAEALENKLKLNSLRWDALGCAPLVVYGDVLESTRQRLSSRAHVACPSAR